MNILKRLLIIVTLLFSVMILLTKAVLATNIEDLFQKVEYSDDFKKWLELSDEEKMKVMQPRIYDVISTNIASNNVLYKSRLLGASLNSKYSLKDIIPLNVTIKNQQHTQACWAFAALSSLETNLALSNYKKGSNTSKIYDYSERHMEYANSKTFANNEENKMGYNRKVGSGGQWNMAESYLTNGLGAVDEKQMPFEDNESIIDISNIQNKTVSSQVYDTIDFQNYNILTGDAKTEIMNEIKLHIQNYGSVFAGIHGNSSSTSAFSCYNNETGAKYCNSDVSHAPDHAVSIVGWDDNYSVSNFAEGSRPTSNGAWIIRNSWGERIEENLSELKKQIFDRFKQQCIERGWNSAGEIPNELIEQAGYTIENNKAYIKIGDNGYMYVSYEDCNIAKSLHGIIKATDTVDYKNIYQYDEHFPGGIIALKKAKIRLCNIFNKKTTEKEYLTQVALYSPETYTCRVYVNPNGESKAKKDMQLIQLKAGEKETINVGYHTLEFSEPLEIKGDKFAVVIEIEGSRADGVFLLLESKIDGVEALDSVQVEKGKCFIALDDSENTQWYDFGTISNQIPSIKNGDSTIKAFTVSQVQDNSLKSIEIVTPPTKTKYMEGENFDRTGMVVKANYNSKDNASKVLDDSSYSILNGNNLKANQTQVTVSYQGKTANQPISVTPNPLVEIKITKEPNKTKYIVGQNFDKTGMKVIGVYQDKSEHEITDYTIENGNKLAKNQTSVTIKYEGKTVEQHITVEDKTVSKIEINKKPSKIQYIQNKEELDLTGGTITASYNDNSQEEIELTSKLITVSGFNNKNIGKNTITVEYSSKITTFDVEIIAEIKPENSDFSNSSCQVNDIKYYTYTDSNKKEYLIMDVTINNISKKKVNDSYEYYYYVSSNQDEKNIQDWVKITDFTSVDDSIKFKINTNDMKNYSELSDSNNLYIYIKEIAIKQENQATGLSKAMQMNSNENIEVYVNDVKVENSKSGKEIDDSNKDDQTRSKNILPNTGIRTILLIIIAFSLAGTFVYIRYKNLSKYIK